MQESKEVINVISLVKKKKKKWQKINQVYPVSLIFIGLPLTCTIYILADNIFKQCFFFFFLQPESLA